MLNLGAHTQLPANLLPLPFRQLPYLPPSGE